MSPGLYIAFGLLWVLVIFHTLILLGLTRAMSRMQATGEHEAADDGGMHGKPLPAFSEVALSGETVDNESIAGRLTALLFVSPECSTCSVTLDELQALSVKTSGSIVLFCRSDRRRCRELADTYRIRLPVIVDADLELSRRFGVAGTPTAILVGPDGKVQTYGQPMSGEDLQSALSSADGDAAPVTVGEFEPSAPSEDGDEFARQR